MQLYSCKNRENYINYYAHHTDGVRQSSSRVAFHVVDLRHSKQENTQVSQEKHVTRMMPPETQQHLIDCFLYFWVIIQTFLNFFGSLVQFSHNFEKHVDDEHNNGDS